MPYDVAEEMTEIDLSNLISYTMSFQPLQLLLQTISKRTKQSEMDNERQDEDIADMKRQLADLQRRDEEREAQLQKLMQQLQQQQPITTEPRSEEEKSQAADQPVDLQALWDEVEALKRLMGEFQLYARRRTIDELYEARKRQDSVVASSGELRRPRRPTGTSTMGESMDEGDEKVGDTILSRAREELHLGDTVVYQDDQQQQQQEVLLSEEDVQGLGRVTGEEVQPPGRSEVRRQDTPSQLRPSQQPLHAVEEQPQTQTQQQTQQQEEQTRRSGSALQGVSRSGEYPSAPLLSDSPKHPKESGRVSATTPVFGTSSVGSMMHSRGYGAPSGPFASICDRIQQDGADIEYLNRVVAEMLNEMRSLHADVDHMRTITVEANNDDKDIASKPESKPSFDHNSLLRRVEKLEDDVERLQKRTASPGTPVYKPDTTGSEEEARLRKAMQDEIQRLKDQLNALNQAQERMNAKLGSILSDSGKTSGDTGINPAQFAALRGTVEALERQLAELQQAGLRNYDKDLEALRQALDKLQRETDALRNKCDMLDEKKADKSSLRKPSGPLAEPKEKDEGSQQAVTEAENYGEVINDLQQLLDAIQERMCKAEANIKDLDDNKADRTALERLVDDLRHLRHLLELGAGRSGDGEGTGMAAAAQEEALQKLQQQLAEHANDFSSMRDGTTNELSALRDYVEQIDHRKADATLVANKAERDYVENALERLMREVEQVLNATNAGLIDTLDKSLNVLRDMLDGKATKNDMAQLQRLVSEEHTGSGAPDALMGFKGFRCLGCNRAVESLRPRVMPNRLQPFVNRLPQNLQPDSANNSSTTARIQQGSASGGPKSITSAPLGDV